MLRIKSHLFLMNLIDEAAFALAGNCHHSSRLGSGHADTLPSAGVKVRAWWAVDKRCGGLHALASVGACSSRASKLSWNWLLVLTLIVN